MNRKIFAVINIDEKLAESSDCNYAPGSYLEKNFECLKKRGIKLFNWMVSDDDDVIRWSRYIDYLIEWAFEHYFEEYEGMSPACYDEWCDTEDI